MTFCTRMEEIVEIDENERYWVAGGYGKKGLLPTDRGAFTSSDGSLSWKSVEMAGDDMMLLGRGWSYKPDSKFTPANEWLYSSDFREESVKHAKPDKTASSFVRFRKMYRTKCFNPDAFVPRDISEKCSNVDSFAVDALSQLLLDVLAYCTLLHKPSSLTESISLTLKHRIIHAAISQKASPSSDAIQSLDQLKRRLQNLVEEERGKTIMNRLVRSIDFSFQQRGDRKEFQERQRQVSSRSFNPTERNIICSLVIKNLDPNFQLHCNKARPCGQDCRFKRLPCSHEGCTATVSQIHLSQHMATCSYKVLQCECGDPIPLKEMEAHKQHACKLRIVSCPFKDIGCIKRVVARDLTGHINDDMASHLLLSMKRMMEHQEVIKKLNTKVLELEGEKNAMKQLMETNDEETKKLISQLEAKLTKSTKELTRLEATVKKQSQKSQVIH